ncbi:MAG: hypothetical protein JO360_11505 [Acidobacteria bacterium]|nr:hypothetical protein [Acidobacteriota bacterium]
MKRLTRQVSCALLLSCMFLWMTTLSAAQIKRTYRRINFARGSSTAVVKGRVPRDGFNYYYLKARAGQTLTARITSAKGTAVFTIIGRQSNNLLEGAAAVTDWTGELPGSEDYALHVGAQGVMGDTYTLEVTIR